MIIDGTITFTEKEIRDAIALELARRLGIGVPSHKVKLELRTPCVAGAAAYLEAVVDVADANVRIE